MRGIQKRKFADVDDEALCYSSSSSSPPSSLSSPGSSEWESDVESSPPDEQDFTPHSPPPVSALPSRSSQPPSASSKSCKPPPYLAIFFSVYRSVSYLPAAAPLMKTLTPGAALDNAHPVTHLWICQCNRVEDYLPEQWDVVEIDLNNNLTLNKSDQIALLSCSRNGPAGAVVR